MGVVALIYYFTLLCGFNAMVAVITSLIFALHPIHVESVAWVTGRKDVLYSVFYMGALCSYMLYIDYKKKRYYVSALILGLLSMLSKSMAFSLPLILFICDYLKERRLLSRQVLIEKIPFFLIIFPLAALSLVRNARIPDVATTDASLLWIWTCMFYIRKFFFPLELAPYYTAPQPVNIGNFAYSGSVILLLGILGFIYFFRRNRLLIFIFLFYILSIFILLRCDQKYPVTMAADRYMYLACLGFCLFLGWVFQRFYDKFSFVWQKWAAVFFLSGVVCFFSLKTYTQSYIWRDSFAYWNYALKLNKKEVTPNALSNLGALYGEAEDFVQARAFLERAIKLEPNFATPRVNLGIIYSVMCDYVKARAFYKEALTIDRTSKPAILGLIETTFAVGKPNQALYYGRYILSTCEDPKFLREVGYVFKAFGYLDMALACYRKADALTAEKPKWFVPFEGTQAYE